MVSLIMEQPASVNESLQERKLAMRYHPDKNLDNPAAAERFKEINKAKAILSDEKKKRVCDSYGMVGLQLAPMFGKNGENFLASRNICCMKSLKIWGENWPVQLENHIPIFSQSLTLYQILCCGYFCLAISCCCCCFCCCGLCVPKVDPNDWNPNIVTGASNPILRQPGTGETSPLNRENDQNYSTMN